MDLKQRQLVNKYLDLLLRRKFFIVLVFLLCLPVGLVAYLTTPKQYQASSLLSYQQQKISPNKLSPDVATRIRDIVSTLTQIVTSRTNLEKIIMDLDLYPDMRRSLPMEDVVDKLRKEIRIKPSKRGDVFTILYTGNDPVKVVRVANSLAAKFIEENLKYRQERATETRSYTNEELQAAKRVMDRKENAMRDYKLQYYNEMPEQREVNMVRLTSLQEQQQGKQESIQDLERTLVLIQDQINSRRRILKSYTESEVEGEDGEIISLEGSESTTYKRLEKMKIRLNALQMKYTEKHPEVKRTLKIISKLEQELEAEAGGVSTEGDAASGSSAGRRKPDVIYDKILMQLEAQKKNIELSLKNLQTEKARINVKIEQYEQWVASAPIREAEWSALTREYGQLRRHYEYLVAQDLEAKSMLNLERRQKGSQFKIEDPARIPEKPVEPNFIVIMGMTGLIGFGLGAGATLVLDFFDNSFRDPETIEPILEVPLLSTIPYVETRTEQKKMARKAWIKTGLLGVLAIVVAAVFLLTWVRGLIVI